MFNPVYMFCFIKSLSCFTQHVHIVYYHVINMFRQYACVLYYHIRIMFNPNSFLPVTISLSMVMSSHSCAGSPFVRR